MEENPNKLHFECTVQCTVFFPALFPVPQNVTHSSLIPGDRGSQTTFNQFLRRRLYRCHKAASGRVCGERSALIGGPAGHASLIRPRVDPFGIRNVVR